MTHQVALITGGSRGIGRAITLAFMHHGTNVAVISRTPASLAALASEIAAENVQYLGIAADIATEAEIERAVAETLLHFGQIDVLVNNAGVTPPTMDLIDMPSDLWRRVLELNLTSVALMTRAVLPSMRERRMGKIINIASYGGRHGAKGRSAYRAAKAGVINLTESVAAEVKPYGIDVNCICPAGVDTEGYREAFGAGAMHDAAKLLRPEEIASVVLFLASPESSAVTGTAIDAFGTRNQLFR